MTGGKSFQMGSAVITETRDARVMGVRETGNAAVALKTRPGTPLCLQVSEQPTGEPRVLVLVGNQPIGHLGDADGAWALEALRGPAGSLEAFVKSASGDPGNPEVWITMNRTRDWSGPDGRVSPGGRIIVGDARK